MSFIVTYVASTRLYDNYKYNPNFPMVFVFYLQLLADLLKVSQLLLCKTNLGIIYMSRSDDAIIIGLNLCKNIILVLFVLFELIFI